MSVEEGEVRAVIGPNGAAKTTLFNVVTGTVRPSAGAIRFAGHAIAAWQATRSAGWASTRTFQITALFPEMSARENARLAAQARHPRRWQLFGGARIFKEAEALADAALEKPASARRPASADGLHGGSAPSKSPWRSSRACSCSTSRRRLSVEETAQAVETLARFLKASRMTVLLVEHDMEVVFRLAHRITVLHRSGDRRRRAGPGEGRCPRPGSLPGRPDRCFGSRA